MADSLSSPQRSLALSRSVAQHRRADGASRHDRVAKLGQHIRQQTAAVLRHRWVRRGGQRGGRKLRREAAHADLCAEDEYLLIADSRGWQLRVKLVGAAGDELRADVRQEQREPCDRREMACFGYRHC